MRFFNFLLNFTICFAIVTFCQFSNIQQAFCEEIQPITVDNEPYEIQLELNEPNIAEAAEVKEGWIEKIFSEDSAILKLDTKYIQNFRLNGAVQMLTDANYPTEGSGYTKFKFLDTHLWFTGDLNETTNFKVMFNPLRDVSGYDGFQTIFSDVYIQTKTSDNTKLLIGQNRVPIGMGGCASQYDLRFIYRPSISTIFSNARAFGAQHTGDFKYLNYNVGFYDSARFMTDMFKGAETIGWVNFKPLANFGDKYGTLLVGAGAQHGKKDYTYTVLGGYAGYEYKKFAAEFEYSHADGYNGTYNSNNKAGGFYADVRYFVHPKVQLLVGYDQLQPNLSLNHDRVNSYLLGLNYYIRGNRVKIASNYIFTQNPNGGPDINRFLVMTQLLF